MKRLCYISRLYSLIREYAVLQVRKFGIRQVSHKISKAKGKTHLEYSGPFLNWAEARDASVGYDSPVVLTKVSTAVRMVLEGHVNYERDGTTFKNVPEKDTLNGILQKLVPSARGIIDFGGGLGGTYIRNRELLNDFRIPYFIIEQPKFVIEGQKICDEFELPIKFLSFPNFSGISESPILILSSVLHYLEDPLTVCTELLKLHPEWIIIDRTPISYAETNIYVQENEGYYQPKVSYPARIMNRVEFLNLFSDYQVECEWISDFDPPDHVGFLLKKGSKL